jgi:hypothetical protein
MNQQPRVMVGMVSHGETAAFTSYCLFQLARQTDWIFQPPAIGSLLEANLALVTHNFLQSECDLLLRIDSDTTWDAGWVDHFQRQMGFLWRKNREVTPWIHGGVIVKRRRVHNFAPAISIDREPLHQNDVYVAWVRRAYAKGSTMEVDRTGGGWTLYSRKFLERLGPRGWRLKWHAEDVHVTAHTGEDYAVCDFCREIGGKVYATFPKMGQAEVNHFNGTEPLGLRDFLGAAALGGVQDHHQEAFARRLVHDMEVR